MLLSAHIERFIVSRMLDIICMVLAKTLGINLLYNNDPDITVHIQHPVLTLHICAKPEMVLVFIIFMLKSMKSGSNVKDNVNL